MITALACWGVGLLLAIITYPLYSDNTAKTQRRLDQLFKDEQNRELAMHISYYKRDILSLHRINRDQLKQAETRLAEYLG